MCDRLLALERIGQKRIGQLSFCIERAFGVRIKLFLQVFNLGEGILLCFPGKVAESYLRGGDSGGLEVF